MCRAVQSWNGEQKLVPASHRPSSGPSSLRQYAWTLEVNLTPCIVFQVSSCSFKAWLTGCRPTAMFACSAVHGLATRGYLVAGTAAAWGSRTRAVNHQAPHTFAVAKSSRPFPHQLWSSRLAAATSGWRLRRGVQVTELARNCITQVYILSACDVAALLCGVYIERMRSSPAAAQAACSTI